MKTSSMHHDGISGGNTLIGLVTGLGYVAYNYMKGLVISTSDGLKPLVKVVSPENVVYIRDHSEYLEQGVVICGGIILAVVSTILSWVIKEHLKDEGSKVHRFALWVKNKTR